MERPTCHSGDIAALKIALKHLNKDVRTFNLLARANFMCCGTCASARLAAMGKEKKRRGAVYYTKQGQSGNKVYLNFGSLDEKDENTQAIGRLVVVELAHYGFERVEWEDENPHKTIIVHLNA